MPAFVFVLLVSIVSCSSVSGAAFSFGRKEAAVFPMWTPAQLPDGPDKPGPLPPPATTATLVAPNYFVAPTDGMALEVRYLLAQPTVYIRTRDKWLVGRYVDYSPQFEIALIRAETDERPTRLAPEPRDIMSLAGLLEDETPPHLFVRDMYVAAGCGNYEQAQLAHRVRSRRRAGEPVGRVELCFSGRGHGLRSGALFLDLNGDIIGLATIKIDRIHAGVSAVEIRRFLDTYFLTGGREVTPKPEY